MALQNYETVAQRLERFWTDHPSGRVFTDLIQSGAGYWIFRAQIFKKADDDYPVSVGHAHEVIGASQINKTSALEVCETSAVGRALALAGYHGSQIASLDEVTRAKARAQEPTPIAPAAPTPKPQPIKPPVIGPYTEEATVTSISVKQLMKDIADAKTMPELMKIGETIANDKQLKDFQKDLLRGNWQNRRTQILESLQV